MAVFASGIYSSGKVRVFTDFSTEVDLLDNDRPCREVELIAAGDFCYRGIDGIEVTIPQRPAHWRKQLQAVAILSGQSVGVIVSY